MTGPASRPRLRPLTQGLAGLAAWYPGLMPGRCLSQAEGPPPAGSPSLLRASRSLRPEEDGGRPHPLRHPSPKAVAEAGVEELRGHGLSRLKAEALVEIAEAHLEGRLPGTGEVERDPWDAAWELTRIRGVGPWTAELAVAMVHHASP